MYMECIHSIIAERSNTFLLLCLSVDRQKLYEPTEKLIKTANVIKPTANKLP